MKGNAKAVATFLFQHNFRYRVKKEKNLPNLLWTSAQQHPVQMMSCSSSKTGARCSQKITRDNWSTGMSALAPCVHLGHQLHAYVQSLQQSAVEVWHVCRATVEKILEAANWAPTHGKTEPWRFVVLSPTAFTEMIWITQKVSMQNIRLSR